MVLSDTQGQKLCTHYRDSSNNGRFPFNHLKNLLRRLLAGFIFEALPCQLRQGFPELAIRDGAARFVPGKKKGQLISAQVQRVLDSMKNTENVMEKSKTKEKQVCFHACTSVPTEFPRRTEPIINTAMCDNTNRPGASAAPPQAADPRETSPGWIRSKTSRCCFQILTPHWLRPS